MATVTLQGNEVHTNGNLPAVGEPAPDFLLVDGELNNKKLSDFTGQKVIMNIVPSLDTPTCATSTRKFDEYANSYQDVTFLIISADLPFAMGRFGSSEELKNVVMLSMMRSRNFAKDYGVLIEDGPLEGITARAIVALDAKGKVVYTQFVDEIADEPDYDSALTAVSEIDSDSEE